MEVCALQRKLRNDTHDNRRVATRSHMFREHGPRMLSFYGGIVSFASLVRLRVLINLCRLLANFVHVYFRLLEMLTLRRLSKESL